MEQTTLLLAYMDDFAIPIESDCPITLLGLLRGAASAIGTLAKEFGMEANFPPGKPEAIVVLRGRGLAQAQRGLCYDADKGGAPSVGRRR